MISDHPQVAECSCIGIDDAMTGQAIAAFAVLKNGVQNTPEVKQGIINLIRNRIGVAPVLQIMCTEPVLLFSLHIQRERSCSKGSTILLDIYE